MRVAVVQLPFSYVSTPQEFTDLVREPIERAANQGAHLVVLPNHSMLALLGIFVPAALSDVTLRDIARVQQFESTRAMLFDRAPYLHDFYLHIFQSLAERIEIYLAPGTTLEVENEKIYNAAYLINAEGQVVARQRQIHRAEDEIKWGLDRDAELTVYATDVGRIGFVIGEDVRYPEVSRILALQNANVLIHPASSPRRQALRPPQGGESVRGGEQFLLDLWTQVQSNQVYGLQADLGRGGSGRSAIYAPVEMTPNHDGILAQAGAQPDTQVVVAEMDFDALQKVVDDYPIFDFFNYELYKELRKKEGEYK